MWFFSCLKYDIREVNRKYVCIAFSYFTMQKTLWSLDNLSDSSGLSAGLVSIQSKLVVSGKEAN